MPINKKYSYQAFPYHGLSFKNEKAEDFNNTEIVGTSFYQECLEADKDVVKDIFPDNMTGVTFTDCNLDNVLIPSGNTVLRGTNKRIKVQNDLSDWILNGKDEPTEPTDKKDRIAWSISIDPKDIPQTKQTETVFELKNKLEGGA
jgi:hypothetical protein